MGYCLLFVLLYGIDRMTKCLAASYPVGTVFIHLEPVFRLVSTRNTGAAFSLLRGQTILLIAAGFAAVGLVCFLPRLMRCTLLVNCLRVMLLAGLAGNLTDRLLYGYVIDFIEPVFVRFAVFNAADIWIVLSALMLSFFLLTDKPR